MDMGTVVPMVPMGAIVMAAAAYWPVGDTGFKVSTEKILQMPRMFTVICYLTKVPVVFFTSGTLK